MQNHYDLIMDNALKIHQTERKYPMGETILFLFFVVMTGCGGWLVWRRTGNYDIDFFIKILGWILLVPGIWGLLESLRFIQ